jgi:hypothetical protein
MKLIRFGEAAGEKSVILLNDGTRVDASGFDQNGKTDYDGQFFASDGLTNLRRPANTHSKTAPQVCSV